MIFPDLLVVELLCLEVEIRLAEKTSKAADGSDLIFAIATGVRHIANQKPDLSKICGVYMMKSRMLMVVCLLVLSETTVWASSSGAWTALDKASAKACIAASGFRKASVLPAMHFSDVVAYDARVVSGVYPQAHMKGAAGKMLCLYHRKTKQVEVQEITK